MTFKKLLTQNNLIKHRKNEADKERLQLKQRLSALSLLSEEALLKKFNQNMNGFNEEQAQLMREKYGANINCEVKTKFNDLFNSWNEEISINPQTKYSSSTLAYTTLPQFKEMQAMGKNIIPLIMEKLLDEDNFFLLPLYDAIQTDSQLKISYKKGDAKILEGEQNKAKRTVRLWLSLSGN